MRNVSDYLKSRRAVLTLYGFTLAVIFLLEYLARQDAVFVRYEAILVSFVLGCVLLTDGARYCVRRRRMAQIQRSASLLPRELPEPLDGLTEEYDALIRALIAERDRLKTESQRRQDEQKAYYTLWIHQIKTPISAMRLLLQEDDGTRAPLMKQELFKVDQYADLALKFVKLDDIASDLVVERCDLNEAVREAVKKYSLLFV